MKIKMRMKMKMKMKMKIENDEKLCTNDAKNGL